jgi:hypothetical protein
LKFFKVREFTFMILCAGTMFYCWKLESGISLKMKTCLYAKIDSIDGSRENLREAHFERPFLSTLIGNTWKQCQNIFRQAYRTWKLKSIIGTENKLRYTATLSDARCVKFRHVSSSCSPACVSKPRWPDSRFDFQ